MEGELPSTVLLFRLNPRFGCVDLTGIAAAPGVRASNRATCTANYQPAGLLHCRARFD